MAKHALATLAVALTAVVVMGACASAPTTPPPEGIDEMAPPEILYRAIVATYESEEIPIALASEEFLMVTSEYEPVGSDLRRRMASRVVRASPGAMGLKVVVEWERRVEIDGEEQWRPIDTEELRERAKSDELELGREIERRFESWKAQWQAENDA